MKPFYWASIPIFSRLVKRFLLQEEAWNPAEAVPLTTTIVPTTNIDDLLKESKAAVATLDLTGVAGTFTSASNLKVPPGKRWTMKAGRRAATIANTYIIFKIGGALYPLTDWITTFLSQDLFLIRLAEGEEVGLVTTGDIGDTAITLGIFYDEEEAY